MFDSARESLSSTDYVTVVRSVYDDSRTMLYGAMAAAAGAVVAGASARSPILFIFGIAFVVVGMARYLDMLAFQREEFGPDDASKARAWEVRAILGGGAIAALHGGWCFYSFVGVADSFAQLAATAISVGTLVGVAARNFGLKRLVTVQIILISGPLAAGPLFAGDLFHVALAVILVPFFASIYRIAGNVRRLLLSAMRGREEATRLAQELDSALSTMPHGLCMIDRSGRVLVINDQACRMLQVEEGTEIVGRPAADLIFVAMSRRIVTKSTAQLLVAELSATENTRLVIDLVDGRHCEVTSSSQNGHTVLMFEDISERVLAEARISAMARYDSLTQLPNRSFFTEQLKARLSEIAAWDLNTPVMIAVIDIDDFKHVNDTLGHPVGDRLISQVGDRLAGLFGDTALVSRFGGDEFIVFRTGDVTTELAEEDAAAVSAALRVPFNLDVDEWTVTASIGIVVADGASVDHDELLMRADLALHDAKAKGKACWSVFHDRMDVEYHQRQQLKLQFQSAIEKGQLFVTYQPIIDIRTRGLVGCEALVRWRHPELGIVSPTLFIPLAEETGAITALTRFVLATAARQCRTWPEHMSVSVNLSANDFRITSVEQMVAQALEAAGLSAERLIVEITETALIEEPEKVSRALSVLRGMGVGVALDDFGTGYSSLGYLTTMSFSKIKIDRAFTRDIATDERARKLLVSVARLSRDLDMTVTVEGVETDAQLDVIIANTNIEHAQGFLFGPPLVAKDIGELIEKMHPNTSPTPAMDLIAGGHPR
ncbi:MAG: EAL domain-containing protein [Alphaproteobacteria bacterium]|nr:EAL domain-containing protein [Alphaproteobacteria bacterium]